MFDNELISDVQFVCGDTSHQVFHAHECVVARHNDTNILSLGTSHLKSRKRMTLTSGCD